LLKEAGEGLFDALGSYSKGDVGGVLSAGMGILKRATSGKKAEEKAKKTRTSPADVIQWSGSKDTQTS
jgi:metacaspase-1